MKVNRGNHAVIIITPTGIKIITILFFVFCFLPKELHSQSKVWIGINAGYGGAALGDVNNEFNNLYRYIRSYNIPAPAPPTLNGDLIFEGNLLYRSKKLEVGGSITHLALSGMEGTQRADENIFEKFDMQLTEIQFVIGYSASVSSRFSVYGRGGIGYGIAYCDFSGGTTSVPFPEDDYYVSNNATKGYPAIKLQAGTEYILKKWMIQGSLGYRFANAGAMRGTLDDNGTLSTNEPVKTRTGQIMSFDFSGVMVSGGIMFQF